MGGKRNQAQRTKNNVKPSSSSRSADLLGKDATKLVGFISLKQNMFTCKPDLICSEDFEAIDPNFQVSLKKLSKKDAITKQKGLQELTELFRKGDGEACKALLPLWSQVYRSLSLDIDNKVRENTQLAHQGLVACVGRNLAPYIRQVAPMWFVCQFDTYPPAASTAVASLKATFPDGKAKEVLSFCHDEIFSFLYDHLVSHTAQSLSKPDMNKEDLQNKYERVVICCLNAYSYYIETLSTGLSEDMADKFLEANRKLLSCNKYWSFASHQTPLIRTGWYACLLSLCKNTPDFVKEECQHLVKCVFSNLDECDPLVLPLVWESALYSLQIMNDCGERVNVEKLVFPKLCSILEKGGLGNAATIYPNILPLLSSISSSLTSDKTTFYQSFFDNLHRGLREQGVRLSQSESGVIVSTFMECLRYVVMLHNQDEEFCVDLLRHQLMGLMKDVECEKLHQCTGGLLYQSVADLTSYWLRNSGSYPSYHRYLELLWECLRALFLESFQSCMHDSVKVSHVFCCHYKFFQTFLNPHFRKKNNLKVKFDCDEQVKDPVVPEDASIQVEIDPWTKRHLEILGAQLMKTYFSHTSGEVSKEFRLCCISQLSLMVKLLGFRFFLDSCKLECSEFCCKLHGWLKDDAVPVEPVLVLTFTALASITDERLKKSLLEDLIQLRPEMLIAEAVRLCLTGKPEYRSISSWLKKDNVRSVLLSFVEAVHHESGSSSLKVLKLCLSSSGEQEFLIGDETVTALLNELCRKMEDADTAVTERIVYVIEDMLNEDTVDFCKRRHDVVLSFLQALFSKSLVPQDNSLLRILNKTARWCLRVLTSDSEHFKPFIKTCAILISDHFDKRSSKTGITDLVNMVNVSYVLLESVSSESVCPGIGPTLSCELLIDILNESKRRWLDPIKEICDTALAVHGYLPFPCYTEKRLVCDKGFWNPLKRAQISSFCRSILFSLKLIFNLLGENIKEGSDETLSDKSIFIYQDLNRLDHLILDCTFGLALMRNVSKYYSSTEQYFELLELEPLAPQLKELIQRLEPSCHSRMLLLLQERISDQNSLWAETEQIIKVEFLDMDVSEVENTNERILTSDLEQSSLKSLREKMNAKKKGLEKFIQFICWKFETSSKGDVTAAYDVCLNSVGVSEMCLSSEVARFLAELINYNDAIVETKVWDFIINSIAAWAQSIEKTPDPKYSMQYVGFVVSFCEVFITFSGYLNTRLSVDDPHSHADEERSKYIRKNWEIFSSDVHTSIINCWKFVAEECSENEMEPVCVHLVESLSTAVCHVAQSRNLTFKHDYQVVALTRACSQLLLSPCPSVQISSFLILQSLVGNLAKMDLILDEDSTDNLSCLHLAQTLVKTQTVVEAMLQDFKLGVMCSVAPFTDSYTYTRAYLMTWLVILDLFKAADSKIRHLYTCWIKEDSILNHLMDCLLHLLPNPVVVSSDSNAKKMQDTLSATPSFSYSGWTSGKLSDLSGYVYVDVLRILPLLSRLWYSESEPKKRDFADKFTATYVSPLIINEEINFALTETKKCENLSLVTLPTRRVVTAIFSVEDSKRELVIQLAYNHPFTSPKVDLSKSVVSSGQTKQKLKQITLLPILLNGSLWDCIVAWKNYLDKKFEGVEECSICYSVLLYGSHHLPKMTCSTCKKKFHSVCLYKWFNSSIKSTCPICRNLYTAPTGVH